jgi:hypothetical protein
MELFNGTSKMNYYEARITIEILYEELLRRNIEAKHIAIISWYKAQLQVVKEMMLVFLKISELVLHVNTLSKYKFFKVNGIVVNWEKVAEGTFITTLTDTYQK